MLKKGNCNWSENTTCRILTKNLHIKIINGKQEVSNFLTDKDETEWMISERPEHRIIEDEYIEQVQEIWHSRNKAFKTMHERQSSKYLFFTLIRYKECGWFFLKTVCTYKNTYVRWGAPGTMAWCG
jgi:hypothetical protein